MRRHIVPALAVVAALVAVVVAALAVAGVADLRDRDTRGNGRGHGMPQMAGDRSTWSDQDQAQSHLGPMRGAAVTTEFAYLTHMIAHHEEAVAAARALRRSDRPVVRAFGRSIVATQSAQIDQMKSWLATWYPGRPTDVDYQPMMRDLTGLSGDRLDRVFLQDMIGHHMMAVMMSQQLLMRGVADHEQVNDLAISIRDEQRTEILWMRRWLAAWFDDTAWHHGMGPGTGR